MKRVECSCSERTNFLVILVRTTTMKCDAVFVFCFFPMLKTVQRGADFPLRRVKLTVRSRKWNARKKNETYREKPNQFLF